MKVHVQEEEVIQMKCLGPNINGVETIICITVYHNYILQNIRTFLYCTYIEAYSAKMQNTSLKCIRNPVLLIPLLIEPVPKLSDFLHVYM